jgi:hypothetical protein
MFPYLPGQSGDNKRLKKLAGTIDWLTGQLAQLVSVSTDDVWIADSRSSAAGPGRPRSAPSWPAGPSTPTWS